MIKALKFKYSEYNKEWRNKWITFYPKSDDRGFCFSYSKARIHTYISSVLTILGFLILPFINNWWALLLIPTLFFSWGQIFIHLKDDEDEYDHLEYSIDFYSVDGEFPNHIWITAGKNSKTIYFPWAYDWFRTSLLLKDGTWAHEKKGKREEFWDDKWKEIKFVEQYPYTYTLNSGEKQNVTATITVMEREWRRYYTPFTKLFNMVNRVIDVEFSDEVGERSGSWKGGTIGCSYKMEKGETPLQTLQRMSKNRKFR